MLVRRRARKFLQRGGYAKFRSAASRFAIAAVFVARSAAKVRVAVTGAGATGVFRAHAIEQVLQQDFRPDAVTASQVDPLALLGDLNGTPEYRANLVAVLARRALAHLGEARSYK